MYSVSVRGGGGEKYEEGRRRREVKSRSEEMREQQ